MTASSLWRTPKVPSFANARSQPTREQMEQLQANAFVGGDISTVNFTAPQWQVPWYRVSAVMGPACSAGAGAYCRNAT